MEKKRPKIAEVVVVEGKDDTRRLNQVVEADTIETIGSAINATILEQIAHAQAKRGVIVFTDPDFNGEKIRKTIQAAVPTVKHAFLARSAAVPKKKGSLGVEHAADEAILEALEKVMIPRANVATGPSWATPTLLARYGLVAGANSKERREALGDRLKIGYTNGKQLAKRLRMFQVSEKEFREALEQIEKGVRE